MSTATTTHTTNRADHAADVLAITADDVLGSLYNLYCRAEATADMFRDAASENGTDAGLVELLNRRATGHGNRADLLAEVACSIPADGLRGALVQTHLLLDYENGADGARLGRMLAPALLSIGAVLGDETRSLAAVFRRPQDNPTEIDPSAVVRGWKANAAA